MAKNRYDGELGVMLLQFDKDSLSFANKPAVAQDLDTRGRGHRKSDKTSGGRTPQEQYNPFDFND